MINGGLSSFFKVSRNLRQGDSLSLLLFIIVIKALNRMIEMAKEMNLFSGVWAGRRNQQMEVSHLFLVDDTLQTDEKENYEIEVYSSMLSTGLGAKHQFKKI